MADRGAASTVARIAGLCKTAQDDGAFRDAVITALRSAVPFDAYAWLLTDPATSVGASPIANVPWLPELPRHIRLKYLTDVNRWTRLEQPAVSLQIATGGVYDESLLWREFLGPHGVGDVASAVYRDPFGCWAFLELFRYADRPAFTPDEIAVLTSTAPLMTTALRRLQANTFTAHEEASSAPRGPVVMVLGPDLGVRAQTAETAEYLRRLVPPRGEQPPVPSSAYNVGAQLLAVEAGADDNEPTARVHLARGGWLTLRAARLDGPDLPGDRDIAVTIEPTPPADRLDLFARVFALTSRESELLGELAGGRDTREIAGNLHLSEHTVQDHLKSMFAKTETRSRPSLLARALGG